MAPVSGDRLAGGGGDDSCGGALGSGAMLKAPPPVLPFGPTLHYSGCGCPYNWAAGCRLCDWGDSWVSQAYQSMAPQRGQAHLAPIRKLKVGFCIPHANVTGGLKMLLEQIRLLRQRGHHVVALTRSELAETAIPPWSDVQANEDVVCRMNQRFRDSYDVDSCDVVVTGIFHQVPEWLTSTSAPILYYEQGHEWLFGDPVRFREEGNYVAQDHLFHMAMHLPVALAAVSEAVQSIICHEFRRSCLLVHNGVDCDRFRPGPKDAAALGAPTGVVGPPAGQAPQPEGRRQPSVLLVGNPAISLKAFDCALATLARVHRSIPVEVHWVCQQDPPEGLVQLMRSTGLRFSLHIDPPQANIPSLYRGHDCFLFTSQYEAWGMPVLEAMASGLPVVCTETTGVSSFATASVDCLMAPPGNVADLAQHVLSVLEDASLAARLAAAARQTALAFTPAKVVAELERALYSLTACRQELMALRLQALPDSQLAARMAVKACSDVAAAHKAAVKARQQRAAAQRATEAPGLGAVASPPHSLDLWRQQQQQQQQQQQWQARGSADSDSAWWPRSSSESEGPRSARPSSSLEGSVHGGTLRPHPPGASLDLDSEQAAQLLAELCQQYTTQQHLQPEQGQQAQQAQQGVAHAPQQRQQQLPAAAQQAQQAAAQLGSQPQAQQLHQYSPHQQQQQHQQQHGSGVAVPLAMHDVRPSFEQLQYHYSLQQHEQRRAGPALSVVQGVAQGSSERLQHHSQQQQQQQQQPNT